MAEWVVATLDRAEAAIKRAAAELDEETRARVLEWCTWAESWAGRGDPVQNLERVGALVLEHESSEGSSLESVLQRRLLQAH
jgi:hypothetical protein